MGALGRAFYNTMSSFKITDDERVETLHNILDPPAYFMHERYLMRVLGFSDKKEFDTFIKCVKDGGLLRLNGDVLDAIDIEDATVDNDLHLHRHYAGRKIANSSRKEITDEPSIDVVNQKEVYYSIGSAELQVFYNGYR